MSLVIAPSACVIDPCVSTGHALLLGFSVAAGLGLMFGVLWFVLERRRRRSGAPRRENFWSQVITRDTVERQMVTTAAARSFGMLLVAGLSYPFLRYPAGWPDPSLSTVWTIAFLVFCANLTALQLRHRP